MNKQSKFRARKGATFIEYALLAGLVAIVVAAAAMFFGDDLKKLFSSEGEQTKAVTESVKTVDLTKTLKEANDGGQKNP